MKSTVACYLKSIEINEMTDNFLILMELSTPVYINTPFATEYYCKFIITVNLYGKFGIRAHKGFFCVKNTDTFVK